MTDLDRRRSMKCHNVRTIFFLTVLLLMAMNTKAAENRSACSLRGVAGDWGYTFSGTLFLQGIPGGEVFAGVGKYSSDAQGNVSSTQTSSTGGSIAVDISEGNMTVNSDCTGTVSINIYDQTHTLLRTSVWDIVFVNNERELFGIMTSMKLADGTPVPSVATMQAKRKRTLPSR